MASKDFGKTGNHIAMNQILGFDQTRFRSTYTANLRLTSSPFALSFAYAGAGAKQFATIYHPSTAQKLVRIKDVRLFLQNNSAAATFLFELVPLTNAATPATGNPAITPSPHNPAAAAAEVTVLALPTTPGTVSGNFGWGTEELALGVTGAAGTSNPIDTQHAHQIILYHHDGFDETEPLIMRPGVAEGYAINITSSAITTLKLTGTVTLTEE
jgi:hypothetical protein